MSTDTLARSEFDRILLDSGILDDDSINQNIISKLYSVFEAGARYGAVTAPQRAPQTPPGAPESPRRVWPKRKDGEPIKITHPNDPASDKQYQFIKKLVASNTAKATGLLSGFEYEVLFSDRGTFNKGQASDLIDRLVKSGLKPKRSR